MTRGMFDSARAQGKSTQWQPNLMDVQPGCLYSSIDLFPDKQRETYEFFGEPVGENRTYAQTNMVMRKCLPTPQAFSMSRLGVLFAPGCCHEDRSRLCESYSLNLYVGMKMYRRMPLALSFSVGKPSNEPEYAEQPVQAFAAFEDELPLVIETQQMFYATLEGTPFEMTQPMRVWVVLFGLIARGVQ